MESVTLVPQAPLRVADLVLSQEVDATVRQRHAFSHPRARDAICRCLMARVRARLLQPSPPSVADLLKQELGPAFGAAVEEQSEVLWLVTQQMLIDYASKKSQARAGANSSASERQDSLVKKGLVELEGGQKVWARFQERNLEGSFLAYLYTAAQRKVIDGLRPKYSEEAFWQKVDSLYLERPKDDSEEDAKNVTYERQGLGADSRDPEREVARAVRQLERRRVLELIRQMALARQQAGRKPAAMVLEYLEWAEKTLALDSTDEIPNAVSDISQKAFAKARGYPPGTVNANLKRFRDDFSQSKEGRHLDVFLLFTTSRGIK